MKTKNNKSATVAGKLALVCVLMFGFGYLLVPLYDVFCDLTGLRFTEETAQLVPQEFTEDTSRLVTVEFDVTRNNHIPWDIRPANRRMQVHPGKVYTTSYIAKNTSNGVMIGQAIPSVTPIAANRHLIKTECFCFASQTINAGEEVQMPLSFMLNPKLPANVNVVTLSYTFFDITQSASVEDQLNAPTAVALN